MSPRASARIRLLPSAEGGIKGPFESGTRSLVLRFFAGSEREMNIGAGIFTGDGSPLTPGNEYEVDLVFWSPEAADYLSVGRTFDLIHGASVGEGEILRVMD